MSQSQSLFLMIEVLKGNKLSLKRLLIAISNTTVFFPVFAKLLIIVFKNLCLYLFNTALKTAFPCNGFLIDSLPEVTYAKNSLE